MRKSRVDILVLFIFLAAAIWLCLVLFSKMKSTDPIQSGIKFENLQPGHHRYTIFVPPTYTGQNRVPLILALHYAGHGTPFFGEMLLLGLVKPAFEVLNAIIVAPDCPARDWTQPESDQFILELLDALQGAYNIDPERILITGYSLGGMGTWHFAARYPDRFTAAIVMAGRPPEDVLAIDWQIPLMVIHGRNDEVVPINDTKTAVLELEQKDVDITFRILEGATHYETHYFVNALRSAIPWLENRWGTMKV